MIKPGDYVIADYCDGVSLTAGKEYLVLKTEISNLYFYVENDEGDVCSYDSSRFKKVSKKDEFISKRGVDMESLDIFKKTVKSDSSSFKLEKACIQAINETTSVILETQQRMEQITDIQTELTKVLLSLQNRVSAIEDLLSNMQNSNKLISISSFKGKL